MPHAVTIDFEDSHVLFHARSELAPFREPEAAGRFDAVRRLSNESQIMPELAFASPIYDNGSLLWCASASDALMLRAIHRAEGYEAEMLWDNAGQNQEEIYVVLTSWDSSTLGGALTDEPALIEFFFEGSSQSQSLEVAGERLRSLFRERGNVEIMGEAQEADHEDHYHISMVVKMIGSELHSLLEHVASQMEGNYGYNVISTEA